MPFYEFECENGHEDEKLLSIKKSTEEYLCKECGLPLRKKISKSDFVLKGSGWYKDGYVK